MKPVDTQQHAATCLELPRHAATAVYVRHLCHHVVHRHIPPGVALCVKEELPFPELLQVAERHSADLCRACVSVLDGTTNVTNYSYSRRVCHERGSSMPVMQ